MADDESPAAWHRSKQDASLELTDEPTGAGLSIMDKTMRHEALQTLRVIRSIKRFDEYVIIARAELAGDPENRHLCAFVKTVETLVRDEKAKLIERTQRRLKCEV